MKRKSALSPEKAVAIGKIAFFEIVERFGRESHIDKGDAFADGDKGVYVVRAYHYHIAFAKFYPCAVYIVVSCSFLDPEKFGIVVTMRREILPRSYVDAGNMEFLVLVEKIGEFELCVFIHRMIKDIYMLGIAIIYYLYDISKGCGCVII